MIIHQNCPFPSGQPCRPTCEQSMAPTMHWKWEILWLSSEVSATASLDFKNLMIWKKIIDSYLVGKDKIVIEKVGVLELPLQTNR